DNGGLSYSFQLTSIGCRLTALSPSLLCREASFARCAAFSASAVYVLVVQPRDGTPALSGSSGSWPACSESGMMPYHGWAIARRNRGDVLLWVRCEGWVFRSRIQQAGT